MLQKNLFFDENADSHLICRFQELTFKENPKCHEALDKCVGGITGWQPRGALTSWPSDSRVTSAWSETEAQEHVELLQGTSGAANPSEIPAQKMQSLSKSSGSFHKRFPHSFSGISLSETLKTRAQVSRRGFSGASGHAWTTAGPARTTPLTGSDLCQTF